MSQKLWNAVDEYIGGRLVPADPALDGALKASDAAGLPAINVAPTHGKLLMMLAMVRGARRILEIGTLGGYSTIWMARALPADGRLVTLEYEPRHAEVARANITNAGLDGLVEIRVGAARETLATMAAEGTEPFDLIFIDADKPNNPHYIAWALRFAKVGTLIIVDNVIRDGAIVDALNDDPRVGGARSVFEVFGSEPRVTATALQTVGVKGYDGFAMALVTS